LLSSFAYQLFRFEVIFLLSGFTPIPVTSTRLELASRVGTILRVGTLSGDFSYTLLPYTWRDLLRLVAKTLLLSNFSSPSSFSK
jgi:hypothetical protein